MRYLVDEDLATSVASISRDFGLDAVTVQELERRGWPDEELLEAAGEDERCIVTSNRNDYEFWTAEFYRLGRPHAGVLIVPLPLRSRGPLAIARALAAFEQTRGAFTSAYLCDFLLPAERYS